MERISISQVVRLGVGRLNADELKHIMFNVFILRIWRDKPAMYLFAKRTDHNEVACHSADELMMIYLSFQSNSSRVGDAQPK